MIKFFSANCIQKVFLIVLLFTAINSNAQINLLRFSNEVISANDTLNEKICDLVEPFLVDSALSKKPHHRVFLVGWLIHKFGGYNWRNTHPYKTKLVGTVIRQTRSGESEYTEFDINHDLVFHLPKYLYQTFEMYDKQKTTKRQDIRPSHHTDYSKPPFTRDINNIGDIIQYRVHCELTPPARYRLILDSLFYPVIRPNEMKIHKNFLDNNPTVGKYGALCLDCNHNCGPEMHSYEWIWWLNTKLVATKKQEKEWFIGLMNEGSNRFKEWIDGPRIGGIRIPFYYKIDSPNDTAILQITHLIADNFNIEKLNLYADKTLQTFSTSITKHEIMYNEKNAPFLLLFDKPLYAEGAKYWIENGQYNTETNELTGYLCIFTAVDFTYNIRLNTFVK